jgi:ADP-ribose pyrophosphatase YjhB (NUDIX family)
MSKISLVQEEEEITEVNKIFKTLMHFPGSSFSDLWDKQIESNKFTYYLKKMESEELIEKKEDGYFLTLKGKSVATTVSGETGQSKKRPYVALLLIIKKGEKYILYHRLKEPYYNNWGFPGAKVEYGEEILASAKRELLEETGLNGEGKIIAVQNCLTINDKKIFGHMTQFFVLFDDVNGKLICESREGTYQWATKEKILSQKNLFPDVPEAIKIACKGKFRVMEIKLIQENEKFTSIETNDIWKEK